MNSAVAGGSVDPADASLVASELAANALVHAAGMFTVTVRSGDGRVVIEVTDENPVMPALTSPGPDAVSGRGLLMVEAVSAAWGVRKGPGSGKTVWAELV